MQVSTKMGITLEVSFDQLFGVLLQLSSEEKIRMAERLRAAAVAEKWQILSVKLPDVPEMNMDDIIAEVKHVRKHRNSNPA